MALTVQLVSPEQVLYEGEADLVVVRTLAGGDIAFLPGHTPFLGALGAHPVKVQLIDGQREQFAVHGGFVEVANDRVIILSDVAEVAHEVDLARARAALERAEARLRESPDDEDALAARRRAQVRLEVAGQA